MLLTWKQELKNLCLSLTTELKRMRTDNPIETIDQKIELIKSAFDLLLPSENQCSQKRELLIFAQSIGVKTNIDDLFVNLLN